jgi:glycosyltransferase involved in cell wall biosynthesis
LAGHWPQKIDQKIKLGSPTSQMKSIPILFTIPNFISAGSGRVMFNILTRLDKEKFAPSVCVLRKGGAIESELEALGVPVLEFPFTVPVKPYLSFHLRAWRAARAFQPYGFKIWHSFHYADDYSEPVIARLSGASRWVYTKKAMSWGSRAWMLRSYLASRIVADNDEMPSRFFDRAGLNRKVSVIHHGIPTDQFRPGIAPEPDCFEQYSIDRTQCLAGCVAQLVPVKDHPTLLQAAESVSGCHLLLAGSTTDQEYLNTLKKMAADLGIADRVHFCGGLKNIPAFLNSVDIFILPTKGSGRMEGCPVALLEAMACGKACIATDIPGSRDLIVHGESGILVPPSNPQALAEAIRQLQADPELRARLGRNARQRVEGHFSIEREVQLHEAMYAELLGRHD